MKQRKTLKQRCHERKTERLAVRNAAIEQSKPHHLRQFKGHFLLAENFGKNPRYNTEALRIGEAAQLLGVSVERLRRASARGWLHPRSVVSWPSAPALKPKSASTSGQGKQRARPTWWYHWPSILASWKAMEASGINKPGPKSSKTSKKGASK